MEYYFSHSEPSDSESDKSASIKNPGSNYAPSGRGGRPRGISKRLRDESSNNKKERADQPPAQSQGRDSHHSRRKSWGTNTTSHYKSRHHSKDSLPHHSRSHHHYQERYRGRSPPRNTSCWNCRRAVRVTDLYCPNCARPYES